MLGYHIIMMQSSNVLSFIQNLEIESLIHQFGRANSMSKQQIGIVLTFDFNIHSSTPPTSLWSIALLTPHMWLLLCMKTVAAFFARNSDSTIAELHVVTSCPSFTGFLDSFVSSMKVWKQYYDMRKAELPHPWNKRLSPFQKLILVRIFQPDKVSAVTHCSM
jgi:hypothetical protein